MNMLQLNSLIFNATNVTLTLSGGSNLFLITVVISLASWIEMNYHDVNKWLVDINNSRIEADKADIKTYSFISYEQFIEIVAYADSIETEC